MILKNNHFYLLRKRIVPGVGDYTTQPTVYGAWWWGTAATGTTATIAFTLDDVAVSATAVSGHVASLAATLDSVVVASNAVLGHSASSAITLDSVIVASAATLGHTATLAATLDGISTNISATVSSGASLTATIAFTLDGVTPAVIAVTGHSATLAATLDGITTAISATVGHTATLAATLDSISTSITALVSSPGAVTATVAFTLDDIVFGASATVQGSFIFDTHDGGKAQKRKFKKEIEDKTRKRQAIVDLYEELVELRPKVAEQIVAPFVEQKRGDKSKSVQRVIDFDALLADLDRVQSLHRELQEIDDEEVLLLL